MIYCLFITLLIAIVSLIVIAYQRPDVLRSTLFPFTRKCLGIALLAFAIAAISLQWVGWDAEGATIVSLGAQGVAWPALIFVFRGIFEVLRQR